MQSKGRKFSQYSLTLADPPPLQDPATKGVARRNLGNSTPFPPHDIQMRDRMPDSKGDVYYCMPRSITFESEQGPRRSMNRGWPPLLPLLLNLPLPWPSVG